MTEDQQNLSAAVLGLIQGDAGQRALIAYSMGWEPARRASGEHWLAPFLAVLLDDPYAAVRYIAHRSLKALPGDLNQVRYDFIGPTVERRNAAQEILDRWEKDGAKGLERSGPEILVSPTGTLDEGKILQLMRRRDNRSMDLQE